MWRGFASGSLAPCRSRRTRGRQRDRHLAQAPVQLWRSTNSTTLQTFYEDIYAAGVDILLVGHDHVYERFAPSDPAGVADPAFGVRQFTVGMGGADHHSFATIRSTSQVRNSDTYGVMKFTLHASSYDWKFLPIDGATFTDSGTASTHGAPNGPPVIDSASIDQARTDHRLRRSR